jgi:hypothetical protein
MKKNTRFFLFLKNNYPFSVILIISLIYFYRFFLYGHIYIPGDTLKCYFPWRTHLTEREDITTLKNTPIKQINSQDIIKIYYPHDDLFGKMLKEWKLCLWNPYNFCGHPLFAESRTAVLYPLKMIIYFFFPTGKAYSLLIITNHILMGTGMVLFLKEMKLSNLSSLTGALLWMYNGYISLNLEYSTHIQTGVYIAFNLLLINRFVRNPRERLNYLLMIFSLAMTILSGHLQYIFYVILFSFLYFLFQIISSNEILNNKKHIFRVTVMFAAAFFASLVISSGQVIPSLQLAGLSDRPAGENLMYHSYITPVNLATLIYPCAAGDINGNFYFSPEHSGVHNNMETSTFIGIICLQFFIFAFIFPGWKKEKIFFSIFILLPFLVLFKIPPFNLIFYLPVFSQTNAFRLFYLFHFAAAVIVATGAEHLIKNEKKRKINIFILIMTIVYLINLACLSRFFSYVTNNIDKIMISYMKINEVNKNDISFIINKILQNYSIGNIFFLIPLITWSVSLILLYIFNNSTRGKKIFLLYIMIILAAGELFIYGINTQAISIEKDIYFKTQITDFLIKNNNYGRISSYNYIMSLPQPNQFMPYSIMDTSGYASIYPGRYFKFIESLNNDKNSFYLEPIISNPENYSKGIEQILSIKYYFNYDEKEFQLEKRYPGRYRKVFHAEKIELIENLDFTPPVFTVGRYKIIKNEKEILNFLKSEKFKPLEEMILETPVPEIPENKGKGKRQDIIKITKFIPGEINMEIFSENPENYLLFISDNYYPGWKATVDGRETPVYRANYLFKAVPIISSNKKIHKIKLNFSPDLYKITITAGFISLLVLILLILFCLIKRI